MTQSRRNLIKVLGGIMSTSAAGVASAKGRNKIGKGDEREWNREEANKETREYLNDNGWERKNKNKYYKDVPLTKFGINPEEQSKNSPQDHKFSAKETVNNDVSGVNFNKIRRSNNSPSINNTSKREKKTDKQTMVRVSVNLNKLPFLDKKDKKKIKKKRAKQNEKVSSNYQTVEESGGSK